MENNSQVEKKTRGRQRVPLRRMEKESNRLVTFSKRRSGLFKKVSEIYTLCGVEAAVIVISPGRNAYSFGHPSVDATINRYIFSNTEFHDVYDGGQTSEAPDEDSQRLSFQLSYINEHANLERKRGDELLSARRGNREEYYRWLTAMEEGTAQDLYPLYYALNQLNIRTQQVYHNYADELNNETDALGSGVGYSPDIWGSQIHIRNSFGSEAGQMAMVPAANTTNLLTGPNNNNSSQMLMYQSHMRGGFDNSMDPNAIIIGHLQADTNASVKDVSSMPDPIPDSMQSPLAVRFPNPHPRPNLLEAGFPNPSQNPNPSIVSFSNQNINPNPNPFALGFPNPNQNPNQNALAVGVANPNQSSTAIGFANPNSNPTALDFHNPNLMAVGYATPNFASSFQGENNPMTGSQFNALTLPSFQRFNIPGNNNPHMSGNL